MTLEVTAYSTEMSAVCENPIGQNCDHEVIEMPTDRVTYLLEQVKVLTAENAHLENQIAELTQQIRLHDDAVPKPVNGNFPLQYFLSVLTAKLGRSYGWRTDYVKACAQVPECADITDVTVQKWQNTGIVPALAVAQIAFLNFKERPVKQSGTTWTKQDEQFLIAQYRDDPLRSNHALSISCTDAFGRNITENAIKGALDRIRKRGLLDERRPPAVRKTVNNPSRSSPAPQQLAETP